MTTMLSRTVFRAEHDQLRASARRFFEGEMAPAHRQWEKDGVAPRSIWRRAGELGFLCVNVPEQYGGGGGDRLASAVLIEEQSRLGLSGPGFWAHSDIVAQYVLHYGTEEQRQRILPGMASGELIGSIVLTEPATGSDLRAIRTTARRDGDEFVISGQKTFITNGQLADVLVVAVKTGDPSARRDLSLLIVEGDRSGVRRGPNIEKIGMKAQDTCELFFDEVRVPVANLLGSENDAWAMLTKELAWERLQIAIGAVATTSAALDWTIGYTKERTAFGTPIAEFQNTRFELAAVKTDVEMAQVFVDRCLAELVDERLDPAVAAMAKYATTEMMCRSLDRCLQLHGGYGYTWDFPIARAYADARVHRIYGGSNEIMRELIARTL
jgi:alkylation response protein AidB-like acyl-CoA dehydrogenase